MNKVNLQVQLGPLKLKNPILTMSGTFGFGRELAKFYDLSVLGGIVVKPVTPKPRPGNPPPRIAETAGGILNAIGIQNPGVDAAIAEELPALQYLRRQGTLVVGSVSGHSFADYTFVTKKLSDSGLVDAIELNISCPNLKGGGLAFGTDPDTVKEVVSRVRAVCGVPLIVKLSPNVTDITKIALSAAAGGADILSLINTLTGMAIDARTRRPILKNITGGLSGPAVKPVALRMVYEVARKVDLPLIGIGGIISGTDAAEFLLAGASAVGVGTANLLDPLAAPRILAELEEYLVQQQVESVEEIVGGLIID
ncbi:MAG TPA: dihydroorotate dehydrogenase [Firmicutes bacterium]|nr:dihydroorotate dehydrogenase [Bacillota bacterium]